MPEEFTINGRVLAQKPTGVQRYAAEISRNIDELLGSRFSHLRGRLLLPQGAPAPAFDHLEAFPTKGIGHAGWEQIRLAGHARGPLLCLGNTGPLLSRAKIVCIHGMNYRLQPESYSRAFRSYMSVMMPLTGATAQAVTTVSAYSASLLNQLPGLRRKRIVVAPNGHEHVHGWQAERSDVASRHRIGQRFVLLVGSLSRHKNWRLIAAIAPDLRRLGVDVIAAGGGGAEFNAIDDPALASLTMIGRVSDDDLAWLYRNAELMLFPSLIEGFGLPLVEAMAQGCAIVSSNTSSLPEVAGDAAVLLPPHDAQAWFEAVAALLAAPGQRAQMRKRGLAQVRKFSWKGSAEIYLNLVEVALEARR